MTFGSNKWWPLAVEVVLVVAVVVVDGIVLDLVAFRMGQILEVAHYKINHASIQFEIRVDFV